MKTFFPLLVLPCCLAAGAATPGLTELTGQGMSLQGMSADAAHLCGSKAGYDNFAMFTSFRHDCATGQTSWLTSFDEDDPSASGRFLAVNAAGDLAGSFKDMDNALEYYDDWMGETVKTPLQVAAVWRQGVRTSLGLAGCSPAEFEDENDGTRAVALSDDASLVVGYMVKAWYPVSPAAWELTEEGQYEYVDYVMPQQATAGALYAVSGDGSVAGGQVSLAADDGGVYYPALWLTPTDCRLLQPQEVTASTSGNVVAISHNGRFVLVTFDPLHAAIYDLATNDLRPIAIARDVAKIMPCAVADNGNAVLSATYSDYSTKSAQYYDYEADALYDLDFFVRFHAAEVAVPAQFYRQESYKLSADGNVVATGDDNGSVWVLQLDGQKAVMPTHIEGLKVFTSAPRQVCATWHAAAPAAGADALKEYVVTLDGTEVARTTDLRFTSEEVGIGRHEVSVRAVYGDKGSLSSPVATAQVNVNPQRLPFFENFDDQVDGLDTSLWDRDFEEGDPGEWISWSVWPQEYNNVTPHVVATVTATKPYRAVISTPFLEPDGESEARLTFIVMGTPINSNDQDFSHERLLVQASANGEDWQTLHEINAGQMRKYAWTPVNVGLDEFMQAPVKVRLAAEGDGVGMIMWRVDMVSVTSAQPVEAPQSLAGTSADGKVTLTWLDQHGTSPVSHLANAHTITDQCVGNEGAGLMTAIDLDAAKMKPYAGQWITSVSAFLYDGVGGYGEGDRATTVDVVIWEDGVKIVDQPIGQTFNAVALTRIPLESPIQVKAGSSYRVGLRVAEGWQDIDGQRRWFTPIYYSGQNARTGVTDLYSEDDGQTWANLYDLYDPDDPGQEDYRNCTWDIMANVSPTPGVEQASGQQSPVFGYEVLRDGVSVNTEFVYPYTPCFVDASPLQLAQYAVRAYYDNGDVSALSEPVTVEMSGISEMASTRRGLHIWPNPATDVVAVDGGEGPVRLYDMAGRLVMSGDAGCLTVSQLPAGVYLLSRGDLTVKLVKK